MHRFTLDCSVILAAALLSLLKVFNGNLSLLAVALFAMGRRGLVERKLAAVHPRNQTPSVAVICVGVATAACMFLVMPSWADFRS